MAKVALRQEQINMYRMTLSMVDLAMMVKLNLQLQGQSTTEYHLVDHSGRMVQAGYICFY